MVTFTLSLLCDVTGPQSSFGLVDSVRNSVGLCLTAGVCTASTPFVLLGDVLDCLPLDQCDTIFTFVEKNVATWKSVSALVSFPINTI